MPIVLENVSFSYNNTGAARTATSNTGVARTATAGTGAANTGAASADTKLTLQNVSITVQDGEVFGIAGRTGSGKSTLASLIAGLLVPNEGSVQIFGNDTRNKKTHHAIRHSVAMVFQYPERALFASTVREDLSFGPRNLGVSANETEKRIQRALELLELPESILNASPFALSGGQQRRVAIAGVLAMQTKAIVLDEPMAGLDPAARKHLASLIENLHEQGTTICVVSHDMDELACLCTHMAVLDEGHIACSGTPLEVFSQEETIIGRLGLELPPSLELAQALRAHNVVLPYKIYTAESIAAAIAAAYKNRAHHT